MLTRLPRLQPGQRPTAEQWNSLCEMAERAFNMTSDSSPGQQIELVRDGGGPISLRLPPRPVEVVTADSSTTDPTTPGYFDGSVTIYDTPSGNAIERQKCWIYPVETIAGSVVPPLPVTLRVYGDDALLANGIQSGDTTVNFLDPNFLPTYPFGLSGGTVYLALGVYPNGTSPAFEIVQTVSGSGVVPAWEFNNHTYSMTVNRGQLSTTPAAWAAGTLMLCVSVLTAPCSPGTTVLSVNDNNFVGTADQSGFFGGTPPHLYAVILDSNTATGEVVLCTAYGGTTLTVVRGQAGTAAASHGSNAIIFLWMPWAGGTSGGSPVGPYFTFGSFLGNTVRQVRQAAIVNRFSSVNSGFDGPLAFIVPSYTDVLQGQILQTFYPGQQFTALPTSDTFGAATLYTTSERQLAVQNSSVLGSNLSYTFTQPGVGMQTTVTQLICEMGTGIAFYQLHGPLWPNASGAPGNVGVETNAHVALIPASPTQTGVATSDGAGVNPSVAGFSGVQWLGHGDKGALGTFVATIHCEAGLAPGGGGYNGEGFLVAWNSLAFKATGTPIAINGGSGYGVGNVLTFTGGTGTPTTVHVTSVSGGVITGLAITNVGLYTVEPPIPNSVTGGTGTGATVFVNFTQTWVNVGAHITGTQIGFGAGLMTGTTLYGNLNFVAGLGVGPGNANNIAVYEVFIYLPTAGTDAPSIFVNGQSLSLYNGGVVAVAAEKAGPADNASAAGVFDASGNLYVGTGPNVLGTSGVTNVPALTNGFGLFEVAVLGGYVVAINPAPVPVTSASTGKVGDMACDGSFLYVCYLANTWRRVAVSSF